MEQKKINGGYVPPKPPKLPSKPVDGERGYVPPKTPIKPPQKPSTGKK